MTERKYNVDVDHIPPASIARSGEPVWIDRSETERAAIVQLVSDALVALESDIDAWLPGQIIVEPGRFTVTLTFLIGDVDAMIYELRAAAAQATRERIEDLRRMAADG